MPIQKPAKRPNRKRPGTIKKASLRQFAPRAGRVAKNTMKHALMLAKSALESASSQEWTDGWVGVDSVDIVDAFVTGLPDAMVKAIREELQQERQLRVREAIPEAVRRAVLERDRHRCVVCKEDVRLELHHYRFVSQGGKNTIGNLMTLCPNHHALVHADESIRKKLPKPKRVPLRAVGAGKKPSFSEEASRKCLA